MRVAIFVVAFCAMAATCMPAGAQVVKPQLTEPPCSGPHNCPNYKRGAALEPPGAAQGQKAACPAGTVYNPQRGTCKVVSSR